MAPVGIASTRTRASADPIFMMAPLPQFFSICAIARFNAFFLSSLTVETAIIHLWLDVWTWLSGQHGHPNKIRKHCLAGKVFSGNFFRENQSRSSLISVKKEGVL